MWHEMQTTYQKLKKSLISLSEVCPPMFLTLTVTAMMSIFELIFERGEVRGS